MKPNRTNLISFGLLTLILIVAAYLRFRGLVHSPIGPDQSILFRVATQFVNTGKLPLAANKSAAGIINPPLIEYLIAIPLFLKTRILWAVRFQAFMSVAAIPILYVYTTRLFNQRVGLLAALLFAVNPWAVHYGRFIRNPNPIPFFSTLLLGSLLLYFANGRRPVHLVLSFLWLAAVTQLHTNSLVIIPTTGLILFIFWRRRQRESWQSSAKPFLYGLILFALLYAPYLVYERASGFNNIRIIFSNFLSLIGSGAVNVAEAGQNTVSNTPLMLLLELVSGNNLFTTDSTWGKAVWPWFPLITLVQVIFIIALIYATIRPIYWRFKPKHKDKPMPPGQIAYLILGLWIFIPVLLHLRPAAHLQNYDFLYILPAPFILIALLADALLTFISGKELRAWLNWGLTVTILGPLLLLSLWQAHIYHVRLTLITSGDLVTGTQVQDIENVIAITQANLDTYPECDLIILGQGAHADLSPLGLVEDFVYPRPVRYVERGRGFIIPNQCAIYFVADADALADNWLRHNAELLPAGAQSPQEVWHSYYVPGVETAVSSPLAIWRNGLFLMDYTVEGTATANQQLRIDYTWQVIQKPLSGTQYHFFTHFLNESGQIVTQEDGPGVYTLYWRPGDAIVNQFYLNLPPELPPGKYTIQTGVYTWPDLQRVRLRRSQATTYPVVTIEVPPS